MHASAGVLTERGGMTSHAAVIARGLGLPCVVGANGMKLSLRNKTLTTTDGRVFHEGAVVTVDGATGEVLAGAADLLEPALDDAFQTLLTWADAVRDIGVRANADTPADAEMAMRFAAEGIGLCRTEHMFFEEDRLTVMREMIFANSPRTAPPRWSFCCRCSGTTSWRCSRSCRASPSASGFSTRRCTNSCPRTEAACASWPRRWICPSPM
jgi:phosphoenolpyruvate synthase/pyruvate phosphate dikinase